MLAIGAPGGDDPTVPRLSALSLKLYELHVSTDPSRSATGLSLLLEGHYARHEFKVALCPTLVHPDAGPNPVRKGI